MKPLLSSRRHFMASVMASATACLAFSPAWAENTKIYQSDGVALQGQDVVSYFTKQRVEFGSEEFSVNHQGIKWLFENAEHLAIFQASPEKYMPQYGGYCAYGVAKGGLAPTDPQAWTIYNEKLYLNFSLDIRTRWLKDKDGYIKKANANWPTL